MRAWMALPMALAAGAPTAAPDAVAAQEAVYPPGVEARVREAVVQRWGGRPEELVLAWGAVREDVDPATAVDLVGSGVRGHWVARMTTVHGTAASVRFRAGWTVSVPVAARGLSRGHEVTELDVAEASDVAWGPRDGDAGVRPVGWIAQRAVGRGEALRPPLVRPPLAVVSGRPVEIRWGGSRVAVTAPGRAAGSGAVGDTVFVRTAAGERLRGVAVAPGVVDVSMETGR